MAVELETIQQKLVTLSQKRLAEVEDFIDFLREREQDELLKDSLSEASEEAFSKVWDNDMDAEYDKL